MKQTLTAGMLPRLITENQMKMFQSQIDIIDNQLKLIDVALSSKQKDNDYNI